MQMMQPPYMAMGYAPPLPPPETPWQPPPQPQAGQSAPPVLAPNFSMPAMPKAPSLPATAPPAVDSDLMTLLKQDVAELPPHIQKAVKETTMKEAVQEGAKATRDLEVAAKQLGQARKDYERAILARSQLHSNWRHFLSDAVKLWQDYATQFTTQEKQLQEQVALTKEAFLQSKEVSAKAHDATGKVQEIDSEEDIETNNKTTSTAAQKISETMNGLTRSLQNLQQQAAVLEAEEELHQAKRPRTSSPKAPDVAMEAPGTSLQPFGQAG